MKQYTRRLMIDWYQVLCTDGKFYHESNIKTGKKQPVLFNTKEQAKKDNQYIGLAY